MSSMARSFLFFTLILIQNAWIIILCRYISEIFIKAYTVCVIFGRVVIVVLRKARELLIPKLREVK